MSRVIELAKNVEVSSKELEDLQSKVDLARKTLDAAKVELLQEMQISNKPVALENQKNKRITSRKSMKQIVKEILANGEDGQELKEITATVIQMIQHGEYKSKAGDISALVAQALNSLKGEQAIVHDRQTKKYYAKK